MRCEIRRNPQNKIFDQMPGFRVHGHICMCVHAYVYVHVHVRVRGMCVCMHMHVHNYRCVSFVYRYTVHMYGMSCLNY